MMTGHEHAFGLVPVDDLENETCVVLLGESGLGKTHVLEAMCKRQNDRSPGGGKRVNLASVRGPADLETLLRDSGYPWGAGAAPTLYLDAFELSTCEHLSSVLATMFETSRPQIRIAVRPGAWGETHRRELKKLYGNDLREYELSLLSQGDVRLAAERHGLRPDDLLRELNTAGAGPLLARPLTCNLLLGLAANNALPPTMNRDTLYQRGLARLLEGAIGHGMQSPAVAWLIAERLALATVFGGQDCFRCEPGEPALDQLTTQEREPLENARFHPEVTSAELRAVLLHTGVFTRTGAGVVHWAHASFAEYLAAAYLRRHAVPEKRLRSLLAMSAAGEVPTALQGVLGWLAPEIPGLWDHVVKTNPLQCLYADPMALSEPQRAQLVEAILDGIAARTIGRLELPSVRLGALAHPGLATQIRARLTPGTDDAAACEALFIASSCRLSELAEEAVTLTLLPTTPLPVRVSAGYAVCELGTPEQKRRLAPLLDGDSQDEHHELFGLALQALWPEQLAPQELFDRLKVPDPRFAGAYASFLYELRSQLAEPQVWPVAVEWARTQQPAPAHHWPNELVDEVVTLILRRRGNARDVPALTDIILGRARANLPLLNSGQANEDTWDDSTRRSVLLELLQRGNEVSDMRKGVWYCDPPLVDERADADWLPQELSRLEDLSEGWMDVLSASGYVQSCIGFDEFCELAERWPQLRTAWGSALEMPIKGAATDEARSTHQIRETWARRREENLRQKSDRLTAFVAGDLSGASQIAANYSRGPQQPGAPTCDEIENAAIAALVQGRFMYTQSPHEVMWALGFVLQRNESDKIPVALWHELADLSKVDFQGIGSNFRRTVGQKLWLHARSKLLASMRSMPAKRIAIGILTCQALYPSSWEDALVEAWLDRVDTLPAVDSLEILTTVVEQSTSQAWLNRARRLENAADVQTRRTVRVLLYLAGDREDRARAALGLFSAKRRLAAEIIEELDQTWAAMQEHRTTPLDPEELASLALRVTGASHAERELRERALESLFAADGPGTEVALDRVAQGFPDNAWILHRVHAAKRRQATTGWQPMELPRLFAFVRNQDLRIVRTSEDLFEVVGEGLDAFQADLRTHVDRLWNGDQTPKAEETLSKELEDFLKRHLDSRRILSAREVELSRSRRGKGPAIDVYVAAFAAQGQPGASRRIEVLIEVKRCIHPDWDNPETELRDRYLLPERRHGWYVVGRYDDGCSKCKKLSLEAMQQHLDEKAEKLHDVVVRAKALDCGWSAASAKPAKRRRRGPALKRK